MRPILFGLVSLTLTLTACGGSTEYKTVNVVTPNGTYEEHVGIPATYPAYNPDGTPFVPPPVERRPVTIYTPNSPPTTIDVSSRQ